MRRISVLVVVSLLLVLVFAGADVTYKIKSGDCLWTIANKYHVSVKALARANGIKENQLLQIGQKLVIPTKKAAGQRESTIGGQIYKVRAGDSLWTIGRKYGASVKALMQANGLKEKQLLRIGQKLVIPTEKGYAKRPPGQARSSQVREAKPSLMGQTYRVQRGDSLWGIAKKFGVSLDSLKQVNGLTDKSVLRLNQKLVIPLKSGVVKAAKNTGQTIVQTAMKYLGTRYRRGGTTSRGFDCSGFVYRVLASHGIRASHSARGLYQMGRPVSRDELKPDDLVFFHTRGRGISHVGIYIGNNEFIHSSSSRRGGGVKISRLDEGYYSYRYMGARRLK